MTIRVMLLLALGLWNALVFISYGLDKRRALRQEWRIPEKNLLIMTLLAGGLGALLGGQLFRHKIRKWYFQLDWYLGLGVLLVIIYYIWRW